MPGPVYLCNAHGQLLTALALILRANGPAVLIYLEDEVPLPAAMATRIVAELPDVTLHVTKDAQVAADFANLPTGFPAIMRRNLRLSSRGPVTARRWAPSLLAGVRFSQAVLFNTGFVMSKVIAGRADRVVLHEGGLNLYMPRRVGPLKALLRRLSGLPARVQVMGEEPWVNEVVATRPDALPPPLRAKSVAIPQGGWLAELTPAQRDILLRCFAPELPHIPEGSRPALVLTQPLERIAMCSGGEKQQIYAAIVAALQHKGYTVYLKNHPREATYSLPQAIALDPATPVEIWPLARPQPFHLAVALCSAALAHDASALSIKTIQLVAPQDFVPQKFATWRDELLPRLAARLAE